MNSGYYLLHFLNMVFCDYGHYNISLAIQAQASASARAWW